MIIEDNHPDQGKIYEVPDNVVPFGNMPISTILLERERKALEMFRQEERVPLLKNMRSKNKSAQRRARKKIADKSRRRNR